MVTERPRKKVKLYLNCTPSKSRPHEPILLLSVFNSVQLQIFLYGAFFDLIEWLKDYFLDLNLYVFF